MTTDFSDAKSKLKEKETKIKYPIKTEFELCYDVDSDQKFYFPLLRDLCKGNLQSVSWSLAEFCHNKIVQSPHENYKKSEIS